ncbi:MAG TPA: diguanylate cyclase [Acidimicrobiales bacterium]|nr:diguanylate cyclase [Acidimicrobiales bacterium]
MGGPAPESEGSGRFSAQVADAGAARPLPHTGGSNGLLRAGIALQPLLEIGDRSAVGYEVLRRPRHRAPQPVDDFARALELVPVVNPAVLVVPADEPLFLGLGEDLPAMTAAAGVMPAELVWLLPARRPDESPGPHVERARWLSQMGFGLALDGVDVSCLAGAELADLPLAFAMLQGSFAERIRAEPRARAEVAALMSYFGRLGTRIVVRQVDDEHAAQLWIELGQQVGTGTYLHSPVVLDPWIAEEGDEIVNRSWFRQRSVRVLGRPERERPPVSYSPLPSSNGAADDREFARALGDAARALQAEHDPRRILETVAELLPRMLPVDRLAIFEADWDHYTLRPLLVKGEGLEGLSDIDDLMGTGITGWAFLRGEPYNCGDTFTHAEAAHVPGSTGGQLDESIVVIPLIAGDQRLGVLDVWRDGLDRFSEEDVERCALIGYLAAAAWRNAQLYSELEQRVLTDKLTGLLNKRWWDELAPREAAQALRTGSELAILLVDLDHFKRVNDTCGHAVGDVTLRNAARVLAGAVRSGDAAVRFGGDEFLLVLHGADARGAERVAEMVRKTLAALPPTCEGLGSVTASIGVALFPTHGPSLEEVVHEADLAMYRAKARGRDQVVVFRAD